MSKGDATRRRILEGAEAMFREGGVERTTLIDVAKASDAALGSVTHFFRTKPDLAAAVLDQVARRLADQATAALSPNGRSVAEDIGALLRICVEWPDRQGRLIATLETYAAAEWKGRSTRLGDRLGSVLAEWAARRGAVEVNRRSPSQLYAVIIAPVLCGAKPIGEKAAIGSDSIADWLDVLTAAAMAAITPEKAVDSLDILTAAALAAIALTPEQASVSPEGKVPTAKRRRAKRHGEQRGLFDQAPGDE